MATELIKDGSKWLHKKEGYAVTVEHSAPHGRTLFRRDVALSVRTVSGSTAKVATLRTKKTHYFLNEFKSAVSLGVTKRVDVDSSAGAIIITIELPSGDATQQQADNIAAFISALFDKDYR